MTERRWFAMTAIGRDRPGIVADLAELIYECDCNLEDSRMTILGSEFAMLLLVSGRGDEVERRLTTGCRRLEWEKRLTVFVRPLETALGESPAARGTPLECTVEGVDKAGIVARVARTIADHGATITDLVSELRPEPNTGTPMYRMRVRMVLPLVADPEALRAALERVATELRVDLSV